MAGCVMNLLMALLVCWSGMIKRLKNKQNDKNLSIGGHELIILVLKDKNI